MDVPLRIALWCAVSSKAQAHEDKTSLTDQEQAGRDFAASIEGHIIAVYRVDGHTREYVFYQDAAAQMPAYRQLYEDAQAHAFDVLHAVDADRLGRHEALIHQVIGLVEQAGAEVYLASAPHPIGQRSTGQRYLYAIQSVRAAEAQEQRTEYHRRGLIGRVSRGLPGSNWPAAYTPLRDARGRVVGAELSDLAPAVAFATERFLAGDSYVEIARQLDASPWRSPRSERWADVTICKWLRSDIYAGIVRWGDVEAESDRFPHLWNTETYRAVLRERERRGVMQYRKKLGSPLGGVAFCARCKARMHRTKGSARNSRHYLRCSTHSGRKLGICHPNYVREATAIAAVDAFLHWLYDNPDDLDRMVAAVELDTALLHRLEALETHLDELHQERKRLVALVTRGVVAEDMYREHEAVLQADEERGETMLLDLRRQLDQQPDPDEYRDTLSHLFASLDTLWTRPASEVATLLQNAHIRVWCEDRKVVRCELDLSRS